MRWKTNGKKGVEAMPGRFDDHRIPRRKIVGRNNQPPPANLPSYPRVPHIVTPPILQQAVTLRVMLQSARSRNSYAELGPFSFQSVPSVRQLVARLVAGGHLTTEDSSTVKVLHGVRRLQPNQYLVKMNVIHIER